MDEMFENPDMNILMRSMFSAGGSYAWADYEKARTTLKLYFDFEGSGPDTILVLSAEKMRAQCPGIDKNNELDGLDERMTFDNYKWIANDLAQLGIDINAYIINKLLERHKEKMKNKQLKLKFNA